MLLVLAVVLAALVLASVASLALPSRAVAAVTAASCAVGAAVALVACVHGGAAEHLTVALLLPWPGIELALDGLSALVAALLLLAGAASSMAARDHFESPPAYMPAFIAGMLLTLLADDALTLVAGFEATSLASLLLVATGGSDEHREAGQLYGGMAMAAGLCLVGGLGVLAFDAEAGGLSRFGFEALRAHPPQGARAAVVFALVLLGAGAKAGLIPLHVWLPPAHVVAPAPVSALMSGAMTKVALYVLARVCFHLLGPATPAWFGMVLLAIGTAGAVLGALRANLELDLKAALACSTIEHVGLITAGLGLALVARAADLPSLASLALGAALLHMLAHGLFKPLLFLVAGAVQHAAGGRHLERLGGLAARMPRTAALALVGIASLAALPPSFAFASEWLLLQAAMAAPRAGGVAFQICVIVAASGIAFAAALGAAAALRLFAIGFLGRPRSPRAAAAADPAGATMAAMGFLAGASVVAGLVPAAAIGLAGPASRLLVGSDLSDRAGLLGIATQVASPGYAPLVIVLLICGAAVVCRWLIRGGPAPVRAPAWGGGFAADPAWLPFGDPRTQYGPAGFSQPLARTLARPLRLGPGVDPARAWLYDPVASLRARVAERLEMFHRLTARQALGVLFAMLIALLALVASSGRP